MLLVGKKYPIVGYKNPQKPSEGRVNVVEGLWELGKDFTIGHGARYLSKELLEAEEPNVISTILGGYLNALSEAELKLPHYFPLIAAASDFMNGSSQGEEFYTAEFNGEEFQIYIKRKGESSEPTEELLVSRARELRMNRCSPYQEQDLSLPLYRQGFNSPGAEFLTNGDFPELLTDHKHAMEWFVRDELDDSQQIGEQLKFADGNYTRTIDGLTIRKYARPTEWDSAKRWGFRWLTYMLFDPLFSVPRYVSSKIPIVGSPLNQYLWEIQYKATTATARALTRNGERNPHTMDQRKGIQKKAKIVKMPQRPAP